MADHYGTIDGADAYHTARGNAAWIGTPTEKGAALVRASQFIDGYAGRRSPAGCTWAWPGDKAGGRTQRLAWPRVNAYDADGNLIDSGAVPQEVEDATYEAALRELVEPGSLLPDFNPAASGIIKREKVDVLETEFAVPAMDDPAALAPVHGTIDALLYPVLECGSSSGFLFAVV